MARGGFAVKKRGYQPKNAFGRFLVGCAGRENRTPGTSLENWGIATIQCPHKAMTGGDGKHAAMLIVYYRMVLLYQIIFRCSMCRRCFYPFIRMRMRTGELANWRTARAVAFFAL